MSKSMPRFHPYRKPLRYIMSQTYANNKQLLYANELELANVKEWCKSFESEFNHFVTSLNNTMFEVIGKTGGLIWH